MTKCELYEMCLKIYINTDDFTDTDLYIIKNLERIFVIKNTIKVQGHWMITRHQNFKTSVKDNIRTIKLPKYEGLLLLKELKIDFVDYRKIFFINIPDIETSIVLQSYQEVIFNDIVTKLNKRITHSYILIQKPGMGKTIFTLNVINALKVKTLIVLPNLLLLNQWKIAVLTYLNIKEDEILIWSSKNKNNLTIYNPDFKVILTTIHTSVKILNGFLSDNNIYFTIYDEIHLYASIKFSNTFWNSQSFFNLGITATDKRLDGFEKVYIQHLNILSYADDLVENTSTKFKGIIKIIKNNIRYENIITDGGIISTPLILNNIIKCKERNEIILKNIEELYNENEKHCIFVFSDRRAHLFNLAQLLSNRRKDILIVVDDKSNNISVLVGGCVENDINNAINNARIIFTTYQYSSVGVNIVKMNCMVLATPRKNNNEQIIGRILRNKGDNEIVRKIVDIIDSRSIFYSQWTERKKVYNNYGFKIVS